MTVENKAENVVNEHVLQNSLQKLICTSFKVGIRLIYGCGVDFVM